MPALLLVAASRGLGLAMAEEFLKKGWNVVATRRGDVPKLDALAGRHPGLSLETLDVVDDAQIAALHDRLAGRTFDVLFVNSGITNERPNDTAAEVATDDFVRVMITNTLAPMRVVEALDDLVAPDGLVGVMSSGQGSVANNTNGMREIYRASKAALNQLMRSYAVRKGERAIAVMAPGWVKTELGGPDARLTIEESIPSLVNVLLAKKARPGLEYLDYQGKTVPW